MSQFSDQLPSSAMALKNCKECGIQVSTAAKACPSCGAPVPKRTSWVAWTFLVLIVVFIVRALSGGDTGSATRTSPSTPAPVVGAPASVAAEHRFPGVVQPKISPAHQKEIDRIAKMDLQGFCARELRKLRGKKTPFPQPWYDAVLTRSREFGVDGGDIDSIQKGGALVGMSQCSALAAWGAPQSVNRSTTSRSTREQWVYGGRNYLYFTDGKLTTIQN